MKTALTMLTLASIAFLGGCQSAKPNTKSTAAIAPAREGSGVWGGLVLNGLYENSQNGEEASRNDSAGGYASADTPDFVDRNWMITRRYEDLRVSNGAPGEFSHTVTRTVTSGPGR